MSPEKFNPSNPEYKEVKDLPQEHQENFVDVKGGFVGENAKMEFVKAEDRAKIENESRPLVSQVFKGKETGLGVLHQDALGEQRYREEMGIRINKIIQERLELPNLSAEQLKSFLDNDLEDFRHGGMYSLGNLVSREQESKILDEIEKRKQQEDPSFEKFNPSVSEYKEVKDLPSERQANFVDTEGGFVRKEAMEGRHVKQAEFYAEDWNSMRSLWDRIIGKNKSTALDELQSFASIEDKYRDVGIAKIDERINYWLTQPDTSSRDIEQLLEYFERQSRLPEDHTSRHIQEATISERQKSLLREEIEKRKEAQKQAE